MMIVHCQRPVVLEREQCQCHIFNIYWPVYRWEINRFIFLSPRTYPPTKNCVHVNMFVSFISFLSLFVARQKKRPKFQHIFARMLWYYTHKPTTDTLNHSFFLKIAAIHFDIIFLFFFQTQSRHNHCSVDHFYLFAFGYTLFMHFKNSLFLFWFCSFPQFDWAVESPQKRMSNVFSFEQFFCFSCVLLLLSSYS